MATVNIEQLGEARWTGRTTWMFISFVLGLALESYVFSLPSIATLWVSNMPKSLGHLLLAWAPIWLIIGIILAGPFSDKYGRKVTLYVTLGLYAIGGAVLFFSNSYILILISLALMLMAGGGEMNSIMVASHELMPRKHRGKATMMIINGINFGGLVLAILALATAALKGSAAIGAQRTVVAVAVLVVVAILFATRASMPESFLWLQKRGRTAELEKTVQAYFGPEVSAAAVIQDTVGSSQPRVEKKPSAGYVWFTMIIMILIAAANTIGFGLMAYSLAYDFFPNLQPVILAVFEGAGFAIGFIGLIADRVSRKKFLFWSFLGTFVMTAIVGLTTKTWQHNMAIFWIFLVVLAGVNSLCYLTEDTVKAEVWPTLQRGTLTAVARFVSIGLYIPALYFAPTKPGAYILFNAVIWFVGLLAAAAWYIWGRETGRGLSIQEASGEA
ncbi:MFS transporter [Sulfobacillus harzensis]|uniref:MFS transporter n=1 Tax=Sulfobacillus harzensis TaxID=2729629 RepID=A0A7Y0L1M3_9FIRM|nr:MFS transporter [Sulfobacillus harzensis]NMP21629.1 MFS transporter [Sulfobacillus harzensis]